jgi:hypothetical protein
MILGFVFQILALRVGTLSVVQPLIATELVNVFGVIAIHDRRRVHMRDWFSAVGMIFGLGAFLALARPSGGDDHALEASGPSGLLVCSRLLRICPVAGVSAQPEGARRPSLGWRRLPASDSWPQWSRNSAPISLKVRPGSS